MRHAPDFTRYRPAVGLLVAVAASLISLPELRADPLPKFQILQTEKSVRFGILGDKPAKPAPTLIVLASSPEETLPSPYFLQSGVMLMKQGYLCVSIDLPCHGLDTKPGEAAGIAGWRQRLEAGQDLMADFVKRSGDMLDYLIANQYTDPNQIAACGTSRGGFSALHLTSFEKRIRCVVAMAPVTELLVVTEFKGMTHPERAAALSIINRAGELADRSVWIIIGDRDHRVGTNECITFARKLQAFAEEKQYTSTIDLHVPTEPQGHTTPRGAAEQSALWIAQQLQQPKK